MTSDEFKDRAIRIETEAEITYDIRLLGDEQQDGVAVFLLGELIFRLSLGTLNSSKPVFILTDDRFESTSQLDGFIQKLGEAGLAIHLQRA